MIKIKTKHLECCWTLILLFITFLKSLGALGTCMTNHSKWRTLFPGIRSKLITLSLHMIFPVFRELILSWGMSNSTPESLCTQLLQSNDPKDESNFDGFTSNGTVLIIGGAEESLLSSPNTYKIVLRKRKGFIRIAMQCGVPIVPVISFGETNTYDTTQNADKSVLRKMQELVKKYTTIAPVLFNGRGFLQEKIGLIPKRHPITLVVGAPIATVKVENPADDDVDKAHQLFCQRLTELFDEHKSKYIENHERVRLEIY